MPDFSFVFCLSAELDRLNFSNVAEMAVEYAGDNILVCIIFIFLAHAFYVGLFVQICISFLRTDKYLFSIYAGIQYTLQILYKK